MLGQCWTVGWLLLVSLELWLHLVSLEPSATYNLVQVTLVAQVLAPSSIGISTGGTSVQEQPVSH